jgi:hypothetical protein
MLTITTHGRRRTASADFAEYCRIVAWNNDVDAAKVFVASVLCSGAMGEVAGTYVDFKDFMVAADAEIMERLRVAFALDGAHGGENHSV